MTRPEQQADEARHIGGMVDALALELTKAPLGKAPPLPDFELALVDGRRIGVEVTESTDPDVAAAWAGARTRLEKAIVRSLERAGTNMACVLYLHAEALSDLQRDKRSLAAVVTVVAAIAKDRAATGLPPTSGGKLGLDLVRLVELRPAARSTVTVVGSVLPFGPGLIQRAIDLKMPKLEGYRSLGADEYWLLVVGGRVLSGYVTVGDAEQATFESPFDRTVFLDPTDGGCVVMATVPPRFMPQEVDIVVDGE